MPVVTKEKKAARQFSGPVLNSGDLRGIFGDTNEYETIPKSKKSTKMRKFQLGSLTRIRKRREIGLKYKPQEPGGS
jgi:hypothetical protein